jgi:NAD(P)H-nitrite reductase large subunit
MAKTVLCHCEDVELDELHSAMEQGYGDVESLKRYTGIGTGKCQGKCCLIQTMRILAAIKEDSEASRTGNAGRTLRIELPTIRQPVLPMRISEILEIPEDDA